MNKKTLKILLIFVIVLAVGLGIKYFINIQIQSIEYANREYEDRNKLEYKNKEIYFEEGRPDPEQEVYYTEYNLIVYDKDTGSKEKIAQTFDNEKVICKDKLYYFVSNFEDITQRFKCYDLNSGIEEELELPYSDFVLYRMVSYNQKIYFGVALNQYYINSYGEKEYTSSEYGTIEYDVMNKEFKKFSDLDIRELDSNFLFIKNGFISVNDNNVYFIDLDGNENIMYKYPGFLLDESVKKVSNNIIEIPVLGAADYGSALTNRGYIRLDINDGYKVVEEVKY